MIWRQILAVVAMLVFIAVFIIVLRAWWHIGNKK